MGKHSSDNKNGKSKLLIFFFLLIIIAIIGVGIYYFIKRDKPEDAINSAFQAMKSYDLESANKYIDYNQLIYSLDEMLVQSDSEEVCKELFKDMEWHIENVEVKNDTATAIVEVTNKDFIKVMTSWMKKIIGEKAKGNQITIEISLEKLRSTLSETEEVSTVMKKINLIKENQNWKIEVDEELRDLVYPCIDSVIAGLVENNN